MIRRYLVLALCVALIGGLMGATADAKKKKKKKKKKPAVVQVDQAMYLSANPEDVCNAETRGLSITDGQDGECWFTRSGQLHDTGEGHPAPAGQDPWIAWPALDGIPLTLDASKPITGEISTRGGGCAARVAGSPCPPPTSVGSVKLIVKLVGTIGGEEVEIGEYVDEFSVTPMTTHTSEVEIAPDPGLSKKVLETLTLKTRISGQSVGHGQYTLADPSSFITIPTLVAKKK